jgi:hypothetical protein
METIGKSQLWSFADDEPKTVLLTNTAIRSSRGHRVTSYLELTRKVAELHFMNREHVLMFRGQGGDYRNVRRNTAIKASLFRPVAGSNRNPSDAVLSKRFELLKNAEQHLITRYVGEELLGRTRLLRHRILRWALIQHYEICRTPLLDVSQSLRVAASFASDADPKEAFIYVIGVPQISGGVTASYEAGLQAVRLASVCPPIAVRPHIQEGYLLGEYPEVVDVEQKAQVGYYEIDFGCRLVAKFRFNPATFWNNDTFPRMDHTALYPNKQDPLFELAEAVRAATGVCD